MMDNVSKPLPLDVVNGHRPVDTREAKWLYLDKLYERFQRPNFYDIGGTNLDKAADYWFLYKTEQISKIYLLHLFISKRIEGNFSIYVCNNNQLNVDYRNNVIQLNAAQTMFKFESHNKGSYHYITTYSFDELDVELMKGRNVMISIDLEKAEKEMQLPLDNLRSLHDFSQLISDPVGANFTVETADGTKFPVHKFLLAARSEVFKAMLKGDTAENINNCVRIDDVGKEDFACIVEFLYTGTIKDLDNCNFYNLLMLADRYLIKGLKELAQHALAKQLSTDNALETLMAADMCNCQSLKFSAFKFIKSNMKCLESTIFQEIHNIQLLRDLCKYLAMKY